jgi:hypothetical protein
MLPSPRHSLLLLGLLAAPVTFAQEPASEEAQPPPAEEPSTESKEPSRAERNLNSLDRFFPLTESASTPPTDLRAETTGSAAGGNDAVSGLGVTQQVEVVLLRGLSLRAGAELRTDAEGFTPMAQAKYQFLNQKQHGFNLSAGGRYKQLGFQSESEGGEAELFVSAGKRWGHLIGTANAVVGAELSRPEGDVETHIGVGYLVTEQFVVGLNTRYKQEFETGEKLAGNSGREFELISGGMAGYTWGPVETSLLAGWYLPRATMSTGPVAMLRIGLNI